MSGKDGVTGRTEAPKGLASIDWQSAGADLDAAGYARLPGLLSAGEADAAAALWEDKALFRRQVIMARHGYGEGEYRYFARPLPRLVETLRRALYPPLATVANRWQEQLGRELRFPGTLAGLVRRCREAGQERPTPLLLNYTAGDYNCLHQDVYGEVFFPLQAVILLSEPGRDFDGGELILVEQRPRMQSRARAVRFAKGDAVVFAGRERPREGKRGFHRVALRHGVSDIVRGHRRTLGIIFHDAR